MAKVTSAKALVDSLVAHGVRDVFGIPGIHTVPVYRELSASPLRHISPRHEQGAGFAADGYARSSGRPGVCIVVTGPGLTNISTAVAQAYSDSVPMLVVSTEIPQAPRRNTGYLHEARDQHGFMRGLVDTSVTASTPREVVEAVDNAFVGFANKRPRPVHLSIPIDHLEQTGSTGVSAPPRDERRSPIGDLDRAADILATSRRSAIVAGGGAVDAGGQVIRLAAQLGAPVFMTVNGNGILPAASIFSMGPSIHLKAAHRYLENCDAVVAIGTELGHSDMWMGRPSRLRRLIRIDVDRDQFDLNYEAEVGLEGHASHVVDELSRRLGRAPADEKTGALRELRSQIDAEATEEAGVWRDVASELRAAIPEDAIVAADNNQASLYGMYWFPMPRPRSFLFPTGFATLGYGIPAAIGAKLANRDRPVLGLLGDGGAMFTIAEIMMAVDLRLAIPFIIVNNGGYGEIRREMLAQGVPPLGVDILPPNFLALAESLGARGSITRLGGLREAIHRALGAEGPTVVELLV